MNSRDRNARRRKNEATSSIGKEKVTCPCCGTRCWYHSTGLYEFEAMLQAHPMGSCYGSGWTLKSARGQDLQWACRDCLKGGRAVTANPLNQDFRGYSGPFLAYWDLEKVCRTCGQRFVFTAVEQRHWYEDLHMFVGVQCVDCPPCRKVRRARERAGEEIARETATLNPEDPDQLARLPSLYETAGSKKKAIEFLRRARNRTTNPAKRAAFEREIQRLLSE